MKTTAIAIPALEERLEYAPRVRDMIEERLDKSVFSFTTLAQADADDVDYWLTKSVSERIEALEYMRRWVYGDDQVDARLQRVLTIAQLGED